MGLKPYCKEIGITPNITKPQDGYFLKKNGGVEEI
jgi:hypothetical protein